MAKTKPAEPTTPADELKIVMRLLRNALQVWGDAGALDRELRDRTRAEVGGSVDRMLGHLRRIAATQLPENMWPTAYAEANGLESAIEHFGSTPWRNTLNHALNLCDTIERRWAGLLPSGVSPSIQSKNGKATSKIALALGILAEHPDWLDKEIAEAAGCTPKHLSSSPRYKAAKEAIATAGKVEMMRQKRHRGSNMDEYEKG